MPPPLPDRSNSTQNSRVGGLESQGRSKQADETSTSKRRQSDARPSEQVLKRPKQGEVTPAEARRMSKVLGKRPDPEPRSAFRPQEGVKRLVIKNLRTASRANDLEQYYSKTWNELDVALTAIAGVEVFAEGAECETVTMRDTCQAPRCLLIKLGCVVLVIREHADFLILLDEFNLDQLSARYSNLRR